MEQTPLQMLHALRRGYFAKRDQAAEMALEAQSREERDQRLAEARVWERAALDAQGFISQIIDNPNPYSKAA